MGSQKYLYLIFLAVGFIFLRSSYGKITQGQFVGSLGETLQKFASKNPYPWFKNFLEGVAIPNSQIFGLLTMWGELFVGVSLVLAVSYLLFAKRSSRFVYLILALGSLGGAFLNGTFWLASSWTSPSTDGLNLLMFVIGLVGFIFALNNLNRVEK